MLHWGLLGIVFFFDFFGNIVYEYLGFVLVYRDIQGIMKMRSVVNTTFPPV